MAEIEEIATFETCLTWIDTIVSLCRNLDRTCSKLDQNFPSEDNSSQLLSYINVLDCDYEGISGLLSTQSSNYENLNTEYDEDPRGADLGEADDSTGRNEGSGRSLSRRGRRQTDKEYYSEEKQRLRTINEQKKYRGIIIKPRKKRRRSPENEEHLYRMESEIIKKLPVGGKMCILKHNVPNDHMDVVKHTDEFDFLLDVPFTVRPDCARAHNMYKSSVPGVYWDRKSWIASWYENGKRLYRSFSSRLYGFYRSKYFAIQTRLSKSDELVKFRSQNAYTP